MSSAQYDKLLTQHRLSNTRVRREVFNVLLHSNRALSMSELIQRCSSIDRVSVYRCIEIFEKVGIVHRVQTGWKYKLELGDKFKPHHHHMTCLTCGRSIEIDDPKSLDAAIQNISRQYSFQPTRHSFEVEGYCLLCTSKNQS